MAPAEAAPPKPPPPARAEPKLEAKPAPKPQPKPEQARPKVRANEPKPPATREERPAAIPAPSATETRPGASASATAALKSAYASQIAAAIQSRLFYPPAARARGAKGVVGVAFTISASGALTSFAVTRSSGDEDLDRAARTLVESVRFPPPPGGPLHFATSFNYTPR